MKQALDVLAQLLQEAPARLVNIGEDAAARPRATGQWSPKQVIGHLIDSAANNHQSWVRGMAEPHTEFPKYQQDSWVSSQGYAEANWPDVVNLWLLYNRHLLHIGRRMTAKQALHLCVIGDNPPATLSELIESYVSHLQHHLAQI